MLHEFGCMHKVHVVQLLAIGHVAEARVARALHDVTLSQNLHDCGAAMLHGCVRMHQQHTVPLRTIRRSRTMAALSAPCSPWAAA